ncbi:MAG TPA: ATP-binding protein [Bryobacteraceae bacterium]
MIFKPIDQITEADLTALVTDGVSERKTLDYKQQLPDPNDAGKRELLADVSSFANTAGGDLIFGIIESAGAPTSVPGVEIVDTDQEILRLDSIIRTGLSPRIRHSPRAVPLANGRYVLLIRSERSWYGPHRVTFKGDSRFWGRTSNGKYELDVTDLRNAFLFANTVTERIAAFRAERVIALQNGQSPVPLADSAKLVMHCIPFESFGARPQYDIFALEALERIRPMYWNWRDISSWGRRINFEGVICIATGGPSSAYTQVYRNGVIEAVRVGILKSSQNPIIIPSRLYEEALVEYLPACFEILKDLGCSAPVFVGISLIGVRGLKLWAGPMSGSEPIDRDVLMLPEILVEDLSAPVGPLLKPTLDLVWNACGHRSSPNFDAAGNWRPKNH